MDADVAILVYDITRKESFEEIQKYWYNQIKEYAPTIVNKWKLIIYYFSFSNWISDLFDKEQVPEANARNYASKIGAVFKLTSACNATGIEELFKSIGFKNLKIRSYSWRYSIFLKCFLSNKFY